MVSLGRFGLGQQKSFLSTEKPCSFIPSWPNVLCILVKDTAEKCSAFFSMFPQTFQNAELYSKPS